MSGFTYGEIVQKKARFIFQKILEYANREEYLKVENVKCDKIRSKVKTGNTWTYEYYIDFGFTLTNFLEIEGLFDQKDLTNLSKNYKEYISRYIFKGALQEYLNILKDYRKSNNQSDQKSGIEYRKGILTLFETDNIQLNLQRFDELWEEKRKQKDNRHIQTIHYSSDRDINKPKYSKNVTDYFVGREKIQTEIIQQIKEGIKIFLLIGKAGEGKTFLARNILQKLEAEHNFEIIDTYKLASENKENSTGSYLYLSYLLKEITGKNYSITDFHSFGQAINQFQKLITQKKYVFLIDNIEPALDEKYMFIDRNYVDILNCFTQIKNTSVAILTSRYQILDPKLHSLTTQQSKDIGGLSLKDWHHHFVWRGINLVRAEEPALTKLHENFKGHAQAMALLAGKIKSDLENGMSFNDYWEKRKKYLLNLKEIEYLIQEYYEDLRKNNKKAYKLLYRLGCYQYQNVNTIPEEGILRLLWEKEIDKTEKIDTLQYLEHRRLVELDRRKFEYYLHPSIHKEARKILFKKTNEFKLTHRKAAEYWENSSTIKTKKDALKYFEAYYHWMIIEDGKQAARMLTDEKKNGEDIETIGNTCYRVGLLKEMKSAILNVINHYDENYKPANNNEITQFCRIYNILGDICWLDGDLKLGIKYHLVSKKMTEEYKNFTYSKKLYFNVVAEINIALCYIDLFEYDQAIEYCKKTIEICSDELRAYDVAAKVILHFLYTEKSTESQKIKKFYKTQNISEIIKITDEERQTVGRCWSRVYLRLFLAKSYTNLKQIKTAEFFYRESMKLSEQYGYEQAIAKAKIGLAEIKRLEKKYDTFDNYYTPAISIFTRIGAKPDLADAYFERAKNHFLLGEKQKGNHYIDLSIKLYTEIGAKKQRDKIENFRDSFLEYQYDEILISPQKLIEIETSEGVKKIYLLTANLKPDNDATENFVKDAVLFNLKRRVNYTYFVNKSLPNIDSEIEKLYENLGIKNKSILINQIKIVKIPEIIFNKPDFYKKNLLIIFKNSRGQKNFDCYAEVNFHKIRKKQGLFWQEIGQPEKNEYLEILNKYLECD